MPDSRQIPIQDRRIGGRGLADGVSPLINDKSKLWTAQNVIFDFPGLISKRRGIQDLDHTNHYSALSGLSTSYKPRRVWCFDNNLFVYLEDSTHGAIAAYDLLAGSWQIVQSAGSKLEMDSATRKVAAKAFDRTMIVLTALGPYRLSALYGVNPTSQYTYAGSFRPAGIPRALDPRCKNSASGGATDSGLVAVAGYNWLVDQSSVGYRVCWIYRDENGILISGAPSGRIVVRNTTGGATTTRLKVVIPTGVASGKYVMQVYRTNVMPADGTGGIPDPGDDMFLAGEYQLTSTDISNGYAMYNDISFDGILGAELYTNFAQEGPDQARFQPPLARCIERFGNCAWYGNVTERQRLTMKVLAVDSSGIGTFPGITVGDRLHFGGLVLEGVLVAAEETQTYNFAVDVTTGAGSEIIRVLKTTESIVYKYNLLSNKFNGRYYAYNLTSNDDIFGVIGFEEKSVGGTYKCFGFTSRLDSPTSMLPIPSTPAFGLYTTLSSASALGTNVGATVATITTPVAPGLPAVGDKVVIAPGRSAYNAGTSDPRFNVTHIPSGEYTVLSNNGATQITIDITGAGAVSNVAETVDATHEVWVAISYNSAQQIAANAVSTGPRVKNRVYWSSPFEYESAPIVNFKDLGNADCGVMAIIGTVSSLFILKEDGVWRARGTDGDWQFEYMDPACQIVAPNSAAVVLGDVYCYTNSGAVRITEGGVTKVSTEIGVDLDTYYRAAQANPANAFWTEGIANEEDQSYILAMQDAVSPSGSADGAAVIYRYHVPSKSWTTLYYNDNASDATTGVSTVGGICMARATRYTANAPAVAYISRMVVAHNQVANSIGIERRGTTFQDYCDYDIGYQTISSYDTVNNKVVMAAGIPASVQPGDVFWARNSSSPNTTYRLPITAISTTSVARDTITVATGGTMTALSAFPAVGTVQAVFMQQIPVIAAYSATTASDAFSNTHMSDVAVIFGSSGRFTDCTIQLITDTNSTVSTLTMAGFAAGKWTTLANGTAIGPGMMKVLGLNMIIPQEAQRASVVFATINNGRAWEPFDIAGFQMTMFGEAKIRRNAT